MMWDILIYFLLSRAWLEYGSELPLVIMFTKILNSQDNIRIRQGRSLCPRSPFGAYLFEAPTVSEISRHLCCFSGLDSRAQIFVKKWAIQRWKFYTGLALQEGQTLWEMSFCYSARHPYFSFLESRCLWCFTKLDIAVIVWLHNMVHVMTQNIESKNKKWSKFCLLQAAAWVPSHHCSFPVLSCGSKILKKKGFKFF